MNRHAIVGAGLLLVLGGCARETPTPFQDPQLGLTVTFPGEPQRSRYAEPTPFGTVEWFGRSYRPGPRMDTSFQAEVANLPPGTQGGGTPAEILATYRQWLTQRFGPVAFQDLPAEQGPGFRYHATGPTGTHLQGLIVVRRGRLHRAEAATPRAEDGRVQAFLESFSVAP